MALIITYNKTFEIITRLIGSEVEGSFNSSSNQGSSTAPSETFTAENKGEVKKGPIEIYNGGVLRKSVDNFKKHHSSHKERLFEFKDKTGKKTSSRTVSYRKSGWAPLFKSYLDKEDWEIYTKNNSNTNHVVYDLTIKQNGASQPVGIMAPFDCKIVQVFGNPNSGIMMIGTGNDKGKTAIFLHVLPSTQNKSTKKQFGSNVFKTLKEETLNKTFKKGELMAYQGNWGEHSSGVHLHVEAMTKEDFDNYITNLPSYYKEN
jgi:hypothetical protein